MLVLLDIDGTLLLSRGASMQCFREAGRELLSREFETGGTNFSGGLDPLIWRTLCAHNGVGDADGHHAAFRAIYGRRLAALCTRNKARVIFGLVRRPGVRGGVVQCSHSCI